MENATTALMMAAGVLIGLLLLSVMVIAFNGAADLAKSYDDSVATTSLQAFNNNFEKYTLGEIDIQSIITVTHFAKDYNTKNDLTDDDTIYIEVTCANERFDEKTDAELIQYMQDNLFYIDSIDEQGNKTYKTDEQGNLIKKKYVCTSIEYNENTNTVTEIEFEEVKI